MMQLLFKEFEIISNSYSDTIHYCVELFTFTIHCIILNLLLFFFLFFFFSFSFSLLYAFIYDNCINWKQANPKRRKNVNPFALKSPSQSLVSPHKIIPLY